MAVQDYGTTNISFSTFDVWSNAGFTDDSNITLSTVLIDALPAATAPYSVSEIYNRKWFYGKAAVDASGTDPGVVNITAPYSTGSGVELIIDNIDYSVHATVTLEAVPTYPRTFIQWRTEPLGGGTQISTNATINLTATDQTSTTEFWAYFST